VKALISEIIVIICCIHCNYKLPVINIFGVFYRSAGVKRLRTTGFKPLYCNLVVSHASHDWFWNRFSMCSKTL